MALVDSLVAIAGTFLLTLVFYSITAHIAARYVLGDVPIRLAFVVGLVPATISFLLQQYGGLVVIALAAVTDFVAIQAVYRLKYRTAGMVAVVHYTVAALLGIAVFNLVRLLATAPG